MNDDNYDLIPIKDNFDTDFNVSHLIDHNFTMNKFHIHDVYEIYLLLSNETKYFVENTVYSLRKQDLMILNSSELHKSVPTPVEAYERYVVIFKPEYIINECTENINLLKCFEERPPEFSHRIHLSMDESNALMAILKKGEFYCGNKGFGYDIYKKIALMELLVLINIFYNKERDKETPTKSQHFKKIEEIIEYINENFSQELSLDQLSNEFFISKSYLMQVFKRTMGFTVNQYIITRRIANARNYLKRGYSVGATAELCGFVNCCHFIRTFKNLVGVSPKQYSK